jgi:hypothetical protein
MSNFNLEKALNGQAFYLKNGYRGVIKYSVENNITSSGHTPNYPYIGYILNDKGFIYKSAMCWNKDGKSNISPDYCATTMIEENTNKQEKKPMKPFNLEEALQGKPVKLRNGKKGIIYYRIPDTYTYPNGDIVCRPIKGMIINEDGHLSTSQAEWLNNGSIDKDFDHSLDIIGMYEEDISELIKKALKENLPMKLRNGTKIYIAAILDSDDPMIKDYPVFAYDNNVTSCRYDLNGHFMRGIYGKSLDIVGLWEE